MANKTPKLIQLKLLECDLQEIDALIRKKRYSSRASFLVSAVLGEIWRNKCGKNVN